MTETEETDSKVFKNLKTPMELKENLIDKANNLHTGEKKETTKYLCHYTSLKAATAIIGSRRWFVGSPINMNDGLERSYIGEGFWERTFFASFMYEPNESIAMWSMYGQPWEAGVMLRIPVRTFKDWIKGRIESAEVSGKSNQRKKKNYTAVEVNTTDPNTKEAEENITSAVEISFHAVAYTDEKSIARPEDAIVTCGRQENALLHSVLDSPDLHGYIKDSAWSYENEYRLRVDITDNSIKCDAVLINIPEEVLDKLEIITGPRFKESPEECAELIKQRAHYSINKDHIHQSLFTGKLQWVYCDECEKHDKDK